MTTTQLDAQKAEEFGNRMLNVLNESGVAVLCSIGHQTGLFDTLEQHPDSTSAELAAAAGLQERYVREWLAAMVVGGIVRYDAAGGGYVLPDEHAAHLTRAAGLGNLAIQMQMIPQLSEVEQAVISSFRNGGGVGYASYPRFHQLMAEISGAVHDAMLVDTILPLASGIPERLDAGIAVADIGCGSGHAVNVMARSYPDSEFVGFDFSADAIEVARAEAASMGLRNARFEVQDAAQLDHVASFDLITAFDAIHDQAEPAVVLERIARALREGGTFLMVDILASSELSENVDLPLGPFLYTVSTLHCMTVSLALEGKGLGTMWGEQTARRMLDEAGFSEVEAHDLPGDILNRYFVARK